jgi:hypothetical protein
MCRNVPVCVGMCWNMSECAGICWNVSEFAGMYQNVHKGKLEEMPRRGFELRAGNLTLNL